MTIPETPGGTLLFHAHRAIEQIVLDREVMALRDSLVPRFTKMLYNGYWFAPEMQHLLRFVADTQKGVSGVGRLKLYKGGCWITGRKAKNSLYNPEFSTFEADNVYNQFDAEGFIKLNALRLKLNTWRDRAALADPDDKIVAQVAKMHSGYIE